MALNQNLSEPARAYVGEAHDLTACFDKIDRGIEACSATAGEINSILKCIARSYNEKYRLYGVLRGRTQHPVFGT